jgi:methylenetetrahydrofolate reductase (NADPH)
VYCPTDGAGTGLRPVTSLSIWTGNTCSSSVVWASPASDIAPVHQRALDVRYELLPFGRAEAEARAPSRPLTLTVTCSPRQGVDGSLEFACKLARLGHKVVLHLAARMVRSVGHLDAVLRQMDDAGIHDLFLIGGDARDARGPYESALDLLGPVTAHSNAPRTVGIAGYPEGHPLIDTRRLSEVLVEKAALADYIVTQICFDPEAICGWLGRTRDSGVDLPVYVGVPGAVDGRRLLEVSAKVGVGASISYLRKQHGIRHWLGHPMQATDRITATVFADRRATGVAGLHFFTFNRLLETRRYVEARLAEKTVHPSPRGGDTPPRATYGALAIQPEQELP